MKDLSKKAKIIIISCVAAFLILETTACIVILPYYTADHVENTTLELFPIISELSDAIEVWEKEGYDEKTSLYLPNGLIGLHRGLSIKFNQISLGKDSGKASADITMKVKDDEHTLSVVYNKDTVAVGGINDEYILLPIKNFRNDLTHSIFSPESGSIYALDEESFDKICKLVENLPSFSDPQDMKKLENGFSRVLSKTKKQMDYDSKLKLFSGERTIECHIDKKVIAAFIDAMADEAESNDTFKRLIVDSFYYTPDEKEANTLYDVDALRKIAEETTNAPGDFDIYISFSVNRKHIEKLDITVNIVSEDDKKSGIKLHADFDIDKKAAGLTADLSISSDCESYDPLLSLDYSRPRKEGDITAKLDLISKNPYTDETVTTSAKASLNYDSSSKEYTLILSGDAEGSNSYKVLGTFDLNAQKGTLQTTLDHVYNKYDYEMYSRSLFSLSVAKPSDNTISIPEGKWLLSMNKSEMDRFLTDIPLRKLDTMFFNLTGQTMGLYYTIDGRLIPDYKDLIEDIVRYNIGFQDYIKNPKKDKYGDEVKDIYFYNEEHNVYVVFVLNKDKKKYEPKAYAVFPYNMSQYHEAFLGTSLNLLLKN